MPKILSFLFVVAFASAALAQEPEAPAKPLPPGPAQPKVKAACTQCHNTTRITEQHFSRVKWSDELDKMEGLGAVIPDTDRATFLDYLTTNFGPQKGSEKKSSTKADDRK